MIKRLTPYTLHPTSSMDLSPAAQNWVNVVLLWIGFGTVVGMVARSLFPGNEPKGALGTVVLGVGGSCIGLFLVSLFLRLEHFNPIGPFGFFVSVLAATGILLVFRFALALQKKREKAKEHGKES